MEKRSKVRSSNCGEDLISNLPKEIIDSILCRLPLKDVVRTSLLSRDWQYKWTTIPDLVLDERLVCYRVRDCDPNWDPDYVDYLLFERVVDKVLSADPGPIRKFHFQIFCVYDDVDRWMDIAATRGVKELKLVSGNSGSKYKIPSCIYSCDLTSLELAKSLVKPPLCFEGFHNLRTLKLKYVDISKEDLEFLISNSPLLENLELENSLPCTSIVIRAANLLKLTVVDGCFTCFLESSPLLMTASFSMTIPYERDTGNRIEGKLIKFLGSLSCVIELKLLGNTLMNLGSCELPLRLPVAYQIKYLTVYIHPCDGRDLRAALCIIRSSPLLKNLHIVAHSNSRASRTLVEDSLEEQEYSDCSLTDLQSVTVHQLLGVTQELKFLRFVLANSPALELVYIKPSVPAQTPRILKLLLSFPRSSPKAEIVVLE